MLKQVQHDDDLFYVTLNLFQGLLFYSDLDHFDYFDFAQYRFQEKSLYSDFNVGDFSVAALLRNDLVVQG